MRAWILAATAAALIGHWQGAVSLMGVDLDIDLRVSGTADSLRATIDVPMQGLTGFAVRDLRVRGDSISFVVPILDNPATLAGIQRGDSIVGMLRQAGIAAPFRLKRPTAPVDYVAEEVQVASGNVALAGTLSHPRGAGPYPAIVFVSGSGAQDRDETAFGFKPFAILADHLTRNGFAVLRCDDRGVGGSTGKFKDATARDFAADLRAQIRFLAARTNIDRRRIGALGHSEGGLIVPMVAGGSDSVAFLVLLGAPGLRGDSVLIDQGDRIQRAMGWPDSARALNRTAQARLIAAAKTDRGWDEARQATQTVLRFAIPGASDSMLKVATDAGVDAMKSPWMREFISYDPVPALEKVRCPVLALFGAQDLQVHPDVNAPPLERALRRGGNRDVTVRVIPRANHLFQPTDDGNLALYPMLPKEFVPGLLDTVSTWLTVRTRAPKSAGTKKR